ncbi:hypothetical protein IAI09_23915 (plasmid) [Lysinibacillus fusiformis]|nr:hypothetical protein [Lysinibacillus fusiformis]
MRISKGVIIIENYKNIFEAIEKSNINIMSLVIISLVLIGMIFIGTSVFNHNTTKLSSRLGPLYFGGAIILLAAFLAAYNGYIPW